MRRFSIKKRVTLWYTGMIAVVLAAVFAGVFIFINQLELSKTEEDLQIGRASCRERVLRLV